MKTHKAPKQLAVKARSAHKKIPRPPGQAGHGKNKGFNLRQAMGLEDDREKYLDIIDDIRAIAKVRLKPFVTYRKQDQDTVHAIIAKMKEQYPELKRFEGGWPVVCALQQFLGNWKSYHKRTRGTASQTKKHSSKQTRKDAAENSMEDEGSLGDVSSDSAPENNLDLLGSPKTIWAYSKHAAPSKKRKRPQDSQKGQDKPFGPSPSLRCPTVKNVYSLKSKTAGGRLPGTRSVLAEFGEGRDMEIDAPGALAGDTTEQDLLTDEDNISEACWFKNNNDDDTFMPGGTQDSSDEGQPQSRRRKQAHPAANLLQVATARQTIRTAGNEHAPLIIKVPVIRRKAPELQKSDERQVQESSQDKRTSEALSSPWPSPLRSFPRSSHCVADVSCAQMQPYQSTREPSTDIMKEIDDDMADEAKYWDADTLICPQSECHDLIPVEPEAALTALLNQRKRILAHEDNGNLMDLNTQICDLVDYETHQLPKAQTNGWPLKLDAYRLSKRVLLFKPQLNTFLSTPNEAIMWRALDGNTGGSKFKYLAGLYARKPNDCGLMDIFQRIRVGYYGEEGEAVISSTLDVMYPTASLRGLKQFRTLNPDSFKRLVLVPECALYLIAQDRKLKTPADAFEVMRDSSPYGYHRFPFDGEIPIAGELSLLQMVLRENRRAMDTLHSEPSLGVEPLSTIPAGHSGTNRKATKAPPKPRAVTRIQAQQLESPVLDKDYLDEPSSSRQHALAPAAGRPDTNPRTIKAPPKPRAVTRSQGNPLEPHILCEDDFEKACVIEVSPRRRLY